MHLNKVLSPKAKNADTDALFLGFLGVLAFSFSLPMTRLAAPEMGGFFVGLARALVAAALAGILLLARGEKLPARAHWKSISITALGVVVGFPVFSSLALESVPSMHGTVINGLLPAATALMGVLLTREKPPLAFWVWTLIGVGTILVFAALEGAGQPQLADGFFLIAVLLGGMGYAEGAKLSRALEGWRTICWSLLFAAPFLVIPVFLLGQNLQNVSSSAWLGFAYVSTFSMFLGFFPWYKALAQGGIARVSPVQMLQPVLSLIWSALILNEGLSARVVIFGLLITAIAWFTRQSANARAPRNLV